MDFERLKTKSNEYIKGYVDGLEEAFCKDDEARKECQSEYDSNIIIADDFYEFKDKIIGKTDKPYTYETEMFIKNNGDLHLPMPKYLLTDVGFALKIIRCQGHEYQFIHFILAMAQIYVYWNPIISKKINVAKMKTYVKLGLNLVDYDFFMYEHLRIEFEKMEKQVMKIEWERD